MGVLGKTLMGLGVVAILAGGYNGCKEYMKGIDADRYNTTIISLAGATTTLSKSQGSMSMESLIEEAANYSKTWKDENLGIFYGLEQYNGNNLIELLETAKQHAKELGMLDQAHKTGKLPEDAPHWVRIAYVNTVADKNNNDIKYKRLLDSELGQQIQIAYESFNDAVSGGVVVKEKVKTNNMSLIQLLDNAASKSWWPWTDAGYRDMNKAYAHTYFALIYANMAKLDKAVNELEKARTVLDTYPETADLALTFDNYKSLTIGYLKGSIISAQNELKSLDNMPIEYKYTAGWWGKIQKKAESLGSNDIFIGDLANTFDYKYDQRSALWWVGGLVGLFALAGLGIKFNE